VARIALGDLYLEWDRLEDAAVAYERALELNPDSEQAKGADRGRGGAGVCSYSLLQPGALLGEAIESVLSKFTEASN